jgi:hypothetical protein
MVCTTRNAIARAKTESPLAKPFSAMTLWASSRVSSGPSFASAALQIADLTPLEQAVQIGVARRVDGFALLE